jgi:GrpB-like predicted nucleotidyltransferase (UPF0157 family)
MTLINLKEYNSDYSDIFLAEKSRLELIFNSLNASYTIEHIGSTAVPGLGGKGVIDIAIGLFDFSKAPKFIDVMTQDGLFYKPTAGSDSRLFLSDKKLTENNVKFHYHIMPLDSAEYRNVIAFRNTLRQTPELRREYFELKKKLAKKAINPRDYLTGKDEFVSKVLGE